MPQQYLGTPNRRVGTPTPTPRNVLGTSLKLASAAAANAYTAYSSYAPRPNRILQYNTPRRSAPASRRKRPYSSSYRSTPSKRRRMSKTPKKAGKGKGRAGYGKNKSGIFSTVQKVLNSSIPIGHYKEFNWQFDIYRGGVATSPLNAETKQTATLVCLNPKKIKTTVGLLWPLASANAAALAKETVYVNRWNEWYTFHNPSQLVIKLNFYKYVALSDTDSSAAANLAASLNEIKAGTTLNPMSLSVHGVKVTDIPGIKQSYKLVKQWQISVLPQRSWTYTTSNHDMNIDYNKVDPAEYEYDSNIGYQLYIEAEAETIKQAGIIGDQLETIGPFPKFHMDVTGGYSMKIRCPHAIEDVNTKAVYRVENKQAITSRWIHQIVPISKTFRKQDPTNVLADPATGDEPFTGN